MKVLCCNCIETSCSHVTDNPNGLQDFDPTAQNVTFSTMPNDDERYPLIAIVEDHINEADQQFICVARLLDPALAGGVIFYPQSTVITIVDNDRKTLLVKSLWLD